MLLSTETLLGLRMTGGSIELELCMIHVSDSKWMLIFCRATCTIIFCAVKSFTGLMRYLFSLPEVQRNKLAFLSNNLCQDPLENFFGSQRQRGGTSDNPNVKEFFKNTAALRVVNSFCRGSARGNCRQIDSEIHKENIPLSRYRKQCSRTV